MLSATTKQWHACHSNLPASRELRDSPPRLECDAHERSILDWPEACSLVLQIKQQEIAARRTIASNPVQMDAIRRQVEQRKAAEEAAKAAKKGEKRARKEARRADKAQRKAKKHGKEVLRSYTFPVSSVHAP